MLELDGWIYIEIKKRMVISHPLFYYRFIQVFAYP